MKPRKASHALAVMGMLVFSTGYAQTDIAVAKVNGVTIPQIMSNVLLRNATAQGQPDSPELRTNIRDILVNQELVTQEAIKKGLDRIPEVETQIRINEQQILINAYMQDYLMTHPITEELMRREYETARAQMGDKEYQARHILVKQEDEAKQIISQLKQGAKFEELAALKSEDSGSRANGGDLGWNVPARYVKPFADALTRLAKGALTVTPVQSPFGWHVIRLDDERPTQVPAFDDVKNNIQQQMQQQVLQKVIAELRARAKIE